MCDMVDLRIYRILIWRWYLTAYYVIINIARVFIREHCCPLAEQSFDFVCLHEIYNWQCTSTDLAICTARIEGHWVGPRALCLKWAYEKVGNGGNRNGHTNHCSNNSFMDS